MRAVMEKRWKGLARGRGCKRRRETRKAKDETDKKIEKKTMKRRKTTREAKDETREKELRREQEREKQKGEKERERKR